MISYDIRKMVLIINYYKSSNADRQKEIDYCVRENIDNGLFSEVISIGKDDASSFGVKYVKQHKRPNYSQFIQYANLHHKNDICVLANIDILFNNTIGLLYQIDLKKSIVALTRWEHDLLGDARIKEVWENNIKCANGAGAYTQDVWAFVPPFSIDITQADFTMGYMGCDNKIAYLANSAGYRVINPSKSIQCVHWHKSGYRTYDYNSCLDFLFPVMPCFIEEVI